MALRKFLLGVAALMVIIQLTAAGYYRPVRRYSTYSSADSEADVSDQSAGDHDKFLNEDSGRSSAKRVSFGNEKNYGDSAKTDDTSERVGPSYGCGYSGYGHGYGCRPSYGGRSYDRSIKDIRRAGADKTRYDAADENADYNKRAAGDRGKNYRYYKTHAGKRRVDAVDYPGYGYY